MTQFLASSVPIDLGVLIVLVLFLFMAGLYLAAFGVMCIFIPTRNAALWTRRVLDISAALLSLPLAVFIYTRVSPGMREASILWLTLPCLIGFGVGVLYAVVRRFALP
jgi:hypothetical protein